MRPTSFAVFGVHLQTVQSFPKAALDGATHSLRLIGPTASTVLKFKLKKTLAGIGLRMAGLTSEENYFPGTIFSSASDKLFTIFLGC